MSHIDHLSHGGRTVELARLANIPEDQLLDYSANLNPLGPPPWLPEAIADGLRRIHAYPDPESCAAREAATARYGLENDQFLFADGAESLILALPRAFAVSSCVIPNPSYSGYIRSAHCSRVPLFRVGLDPSEDYSISGKIFVAKFESALETAPQPILTFLGAPNNPVGGKMQEDVLLNLIRRNPHVFFILDESFAELAGSYSGLLPLAGAAGYENLIVIRSLTKTWAVPGARVGFACASAPNLEMLRAQLPSWPLSSFAEEIARRAFNDREWPEKAAKLIADESFSLQKAIESTRKCRVYASGANFLLVEVIPTSRHPSPAKELAVQLLSRGIAVRTFTLEEGLDGRFMRIAVRGREENVRFLEAFHESLGAIICATPEADWCTPRDLNDKE